MPETSSTRIMDERALRRVIARMAREIVERNQGVEGLVLMGIHRRGVELSEMIREEIEREEGQAVPWGTIDITLYRDDLMTVGPRPIVGETELPPEGIEGRAVVLVDDVIFTGRTIRAALNEIMDWGRPARIWLCVLVDRGGRELPIQPDVVGRQLRARDDQEVKVLVPKEDGALGVELEDIPPEAA